MRVGLVLDNPKRDLGGILLLAYQLMKQDHEIFIIPLYEQGYDIPVLNLDLLVVNYVRQNNIEFLQTYKKLGIFIAVLDTEGGVLRDSGNLSPEFISKLFRKIQASNFVDHYFFWGEKLYKAFESYSGMFRSQLSLTGCPRYDYCHPKWRSLLGDRSNLYILINLNFPSINPWWGNTEYKKNKFIFNSANEETKRAIKIAGLDGNLYRLFINEQKKVFHIYLKTICQLAQINPEKKIVVRPHPFENQKIYKDYFVNFKNISVDSGGEVLEAINKSSIVINLNCSTSVESRLLDKVPVSLEFLNSNILRNNLNLPTNISFKAYDFNELNKIVKNVSLEKMDHSKKNKISRAIKKWFYKCDGNASYRIANIICGFNYVNFHSNKIEQLICAIKSSYKKFHLRFFIQGIASIILGSNFITQIKNKIHPERQMKYTNILEIKNRLEKIAESEGRKVNFEVKHAKNELTLMKLSSMHCQQIF